jgi:hypothetical protein
MESFGVAVVSRTAHRLVVCFVHNAECKNTKWFGECVTATFSQCHWLCTRLAISQWQHTLCPSLTPRIHGGSFTDGSITDSGLNGTTLARDSGIITVFVQYRLGLLGYLPPPSAPTSPNPNFGLNDVLLALEVVRDNIGRVGGDAGKVTVAGQSSGATMARCEYDACLRC